MANEVKIQKKVYDPTTFNKVIDRSFKTFAQPPDVAEEPTIEEPVAEEVVPEEEPVQQIYKTTTKKRKKKK